MANQPNSVGGYFVRLDGLRAIAISLVMIEHFGGLLAKPLSVGYYGVDLFFVISGFLITTILLRSKEPFGLALKNFIGRRSLRIFPVYYLALVVLFALDFGDTRHNIVWLVTYTWNYVAPLTEDPNNLFYLWSLSVEEQFYLFWPFVVLLLRNRPRLLILFTSCVVLLSYLQLMFNLVPALSVFTYTGLPNRMGSLGLGAVGAMLIMTRWFPHALVSGRLAECITLGMLIWAMSSRSSRYQFVVMGFCSLIFVVKCVSNGFAFDVVNRFLSHRFMTTVGRISYGIYVYHWPLGLAFGKYFFDPFWLGIDFSVLGPLEKLRWNSWIFKLPLVYSLTFCVAWISHQYFERPLLRLKDVWFPQTLP